MSEDTDIKFDVNVEVRRRMIQAKLQKLYNKRQLIEADRMEVDALITRIQVELSELDVNYPSYGACLPVAYCK